MYNLKTAIKTAILPLILLFLGTDASFSCDPNESCNRCLVSVFGGCQHRGNDPLCEARKKACQIPVVGPIVTAPGMPMGPGGIAGPGGPGIGPVPGESLKSCFSNPSGCPSEIASNLAYSTVAPIVDQYIQFLERQGDGRWLGIPPGIINAISSQYPEINLSNVRYATGINTAHGQAITIGNSIFFPGELNLNNAYDQILLFHELEHVVQYQRRGGIRQFLAEYIFKVPCKIIQMRSFNVHDFIDIEQAAIAKSNIVYDFVTRTFSAQPAYYCVTNAGSCGPMGPMQRGGGCTCMSPVGPYSGIAQ